MKPVAIIGVWLIALIIDGVVLPALTGLPSGLGIMVLLSALAIIFGIQRWVIGLGIILAGATELMTGAYFGTIIGAWLTLAWIWHILNQFLNMKPPTENNFLRTLGPLIILGLIVFGLGESALWALSRFAYEPGLAGATLFDILRSPIILGIAVAEFAVIFFIFNFISTISDA